MKKMNMCNSKSGKLSFNMERMQQIAIKKITKHKEQDSNISLEQMILLDKIITSEILPLREENRYNQLTGMFIDEVGNYENHYDVYGLSKTYKQENRQKTLYF